MVVFTELQSLTLNYGHSGLSTAALLGLALLELYIWSRVSMCSPQYYDDVSCSGGYSPAAGLHLSVPRPHRRSLRPQVRPATVWVHWKDLCVS